MKKKPYISVIITYFNKRRFIKKTLDSIFFQSFKNYELIFVYDDSNYEDLKYIKPYLKAFKNTKIIINKKNLGVARSRNKALAKCKGNYIAFIDSEAFSSVAYDIVVITIVVTISFSNPQRLCAS